MRDDKQVAANAERESLKDRAEETAHDMREKITTTAQNIKNTVNEKLDDIKREHRS